MENLFKTILVLFLAISFLKAEIINQIREGEFTIDYYKDNEGILERVIELAKRRPVTTKEMSYSLGININEIIKCLRLLLKDDKIKYKIYRNDRYYYC